MRILEWKAFLEEGLPVDDGLAAMSVGVFDGVHRGHKALIERILYRKNQSLPVVVTFRQNHKTSRPVYFGNISSFRQKTAIFESMGVAVTIVADLSESFRRISGTEFFRLLWERGKMGFLAIGSNFRCGFNQDTDAELIQKINASQGIPTEIVQTLTEDNEPISSNRIRRIIHDGKLREAAVMLGRPFTLDVDSESFSEAGNSSTVLDIARLGFVLPPPGKYKVLLHVKNGGSKQVQIQIEEEQIHIPAFSGGQNIQLEFIC